MKRICKENKKCQRKSGCQRKSACQRKRACQQKAGGATDYASLFYARGADPAELSRFTLQNIDKAPMFNPLQENTVFPTGTSGVIPTGSYYNAIAPAQLQNSVGPAVAQNGGSHRKTSRSHVVQVAPVIKHVVNAGGTMVKNVLKGVENVGNGVLRGIGTLVGKKSKSQRGGKKLLKKKANKWIEHVKKFAKEHGMTYGNALKDAKVKASYKKV